ncbi:MAG: 3D domain-containing protein [Clostridium sp.]|nr:3D domain-containing protein [Clostridium sp.]
MIRKALLAAAVAAVSLMSAFPALAQVADGQKVTVVEPFPEEQLKTEYSEASTSNKSKLNLTSTSDDEYVNAGPGAEKKAPEPVKPKEFSLGTFKITGYCNCEICSGGHNLTYSGTVPTPNHTVSADLSRYPLGTKLKVGGTVYTVEDMGSSVNGNTLDIFYSSHEEALAKGTYTAEVFLVEE